MNIIEHDAANRQLFNFGIDSVYIVNSYFVFSFHFLFHFIFGKRRARISIEKFPEKKKCICNINTQRHRMYTDMGSQTHQVDMWIAFYCCTLYIKQPGYKQQQRKKNTRGAIEQKILEERKNKKERERERKRSDRRNMYELSLTGFLFYFLGSHHFLRFHFI